MLKFFQINEYNSNVISKIKWLDISPTVSQYNIHIYNK